MDSQRSHRRCGCSDKSKLSCGSWESIASSVTTDSVTWTVGGAISTLARVRVYLVSNNALGDTSNANFTILGPSLTVNNPNGGEAWIIGQPQLVTWSRNNAAGAVTVQVNRSYPTGSWQTISSSAVGDNVTYTPSGTATSSARFRVYLNSNISVSDTSNANVSFVVATLALTTPDGGEAFTLGTNMPIRWTRTNAAGDVKVLLNRSYATGSWETLTTTSADSFIWVTSGAASAQCRIKVELVSATSVSDISYSNFSLEQRSLRLTAPNGGDILYVGTNSTISFTRTNAAGNATLQINRNYPAGVWENLTTNLTASEYSWSVVGPLSSSSRIRAFLTADTTVGDTSDANFTVSNPTITITSPNGGEQWLIGTSHSITWTRNNASGGVTVQIDRNYPSGVWELITGSETTSSYPWSVIGPATAAARIRVMLNSNPDVCDTSNAVFAVATPTLTLSAPNGGEAYYLGGEMTIRWARTFAAGDVTVLFNRNYPVSSWETLTTTANADSFVWDISGTSSTTCRVIVQLTANTSVSDMSAANFSILSKSLRITQPNGGEIYSIGSAFPVNITRVNAPEYVTLQVNRNYPSLNWEFLTNTLTGTSFLWDVTGLPSSGARIRAFLTDDPSIGDTSDANFSISNPTITLTYPVGGEIWLVGSNRTITWQRYGTPDNVKLEFNRNYPSGTWEQIATSLSGSIYTWTVTAPTTSNARFKVTSLANSSLGDTSDADFQIVQSALTLAAPNGGETWVTGQAKTINWIRNFATGTVTVQLNRNYPTGAWESLTTSNATDSLVWTVSGSVSANARMRVYLTTNSNIGDTSDAVFSIVSPSLELTYPVGTESWYAGSNVNIAWNRLNAPGNVTVQINRSYPSTSWVTLTNNVSTSSYQWTVIGPYTGNARIRVFLTDNIAIGDTCNANISIYVPILTLGSPYGGEILYTGTTVQSIYTDMTQSGMRRCRLIAVIRPVRGKP